MHRRTNFAHGYFSEKVKLGRCGAKSFSSHSYMHFRALPFARVKNNGTPRRCGRGCCAATQPAGKPGKSPPTQLPRRQQARRGGNNQQRTQLLPIHGDNIPPKSVRATIVLHWL
jgi:hypothetical protein